MQSTAATAQPEGAAAPHHESFDWAGNSYYGRSGRYIALADEESLRPGDQVVVLGSPNDRQWKPEVTDILDTGQFEAARKTFNDRGFMEVYKDKPLRDQIGWYWTFKDVNPAIPIARLAVDGGSVNNETGWDFIAVARLPANAIVLEPPARTERGALPVTIPAAEAEAFMLKRADALAGKPCVAGHPLARAIRYSAPGDQHQVFELFVGNPVMLERPVDGSTMASIAMCQIIIADGADLQTIEFARSSTEEERVDTGAPTLNENTWFATMDVTAGYLSVDDGRNWQRAIINEGFEGTAYAIDHVGDGARVFDAYHYTTH